MNKWKRWDLWKKARDFCNRKMTSVWFEGGNCDSCCSNCKQWESKGNIIKTTPLDYGSEQRTCSNCAMNGRLYLRQQDLLKFSN
jgi:hypothetical protein